MAGQVWQTNTLGGYMYSDELSDDLRSQLQPMSRFRQFCDAKDATGKRANKGDKYNWNVYSDVQDGGDKLDERQAMPETNFTVRQGQLTIEEYGNSVPYSGLLDNFSKHDVKTIIKQALRNDVAKTLDGAAHAQFDATLLKVNAVSGTSTTAVISFETDGTVGVTNNVALNKEHVKGIVDQMKERNIPSYDGDDYHAVAWPTTLRTFKNDLETINQYSDEGFRQIRAGEVGRYENTRFCEQTNVAAGGAEDSTTWNFRTADAWDNAASDWAFFFGEDTVAEAIVVPEEIRGKLPGDFGRSRGVAWYYLGGFGIVHGDSSDVVNARIVKWDSAA